ncbi:hypothetical protein J5N97_012445 [Dioscorea zingiberensis]|uniref:Pentatricopeptide repeat-containing protein n=1 Tax=Dioscorea zingiberensis TaxID=325984 RepID=A0A9D5CNZ3_9LILI|nr:hypothetical protein J5N97_012445 [Dioscorea zingiberensis]
MQELIIARGFSPLLLARHRVFSSLSIQTQRQELLVLHENHQASDDARRIRNAIKGVRSRVVEDIVRSLQSDHPCSTINLTTNLVDGLLHGFGDDWKSALGLFNWAASRPGYAHSQFACDRVVDMLGRMRQFERMWDFVGEIRGGGCFSFTLGTVAKIMRRLVGAGRWRDAVKVFDDLPSMGFEQDVESMNLLLDALCKDGKVEVAREVFAVLKAQISPNAYTFNILVHGWCKVRRMDEAKWTMQEFEGYGFRPSVITYSTLLKAYCRRLNFARVYEMLDEMQSAGCPPNVVTYTVIMKSIARSGRLEESARVLERMRTSCCRPDTFFYNCLINALGKAGQVQEAFQMFEVDMRADGVDRSVSTYNTVIAVLCQDDRDRDALNVLKEMENSASMKPDLQTYAPLLKMCLKTITMKEELLSELLNDIVNKHHLSLDLSTYSLLIHGLCKTGNIGWACNLFEEMVEMDISPRTQTCRLLLDEAGQRGLYDIVERIKSALKQIESLAT